MEKKIQLYDISLLHIMYPWHVPSLIFVPVPCLAQEKEPKVNSEEANDGCGGGTLERRKKRRKTALFTDVVVAHTDAKSNEMNISHV